MSSGEWPELRPEPEDPPVEALPPQAGTGPVGQGALAAAVALISAAYPASAVVLAGLGSFLPALGKKLGRIQNERTGELLSGAVDASTLTREEVARQLIERDDMALLAAEAIDAARRTRLPGKASSLGRALGSILEDDARLDEEAIWIRIISTVEPPHLRILKLLLEDKGALAGVGDTGWGPGPVLTILQLGEQVGVDTTVLPLVQDLLGAGLVTTPGITSMTEGVPDAFEQSIQGTRLGAELFYRLSLAGSSEFK